MGRRRFMKVASAIGISASSLRLGSQDGLVSAMGNPRNEVSYVSRMEVVEDDDGTPIAREPVYKTCPRDIWVDIKTSVAAQNQVSQIVNRRFNSDNLEVTMAKNRNSPTGYVINVEYCVTNLPDGSTEEPQASFETVQDTLPSTVGATVGQDQWRASRDSIPVHLNRSRKEQLQGSGDAEYAPSNDCDSNPVNYSHDWSNIPAGCALTGYPAGGSATANGTFWHWDYSEYCLITVGHTVKDPDSTYATWGNPDKSSIDGYVLDKVEELPRDYALLRTHDGDTQQRIRSGGNNPTTDFDVLGGVTDDEIQTEYLENQSQIKLQGHTSGRLSTFAVEWEGLPSETGFSRVIVDEEVCTGDSGGLIFDETDDGIGANILGMIARDDVGQTRCITAESIENAYNGFYH